ncbi:hypothetical protein [uncultured Pseudoflavonifractor sp.]|uniref:hypothetical protein n=1 Tax=uncultured Pseudoflavonifractor sp. TaxID=1221379 RepID=UPI0025FD9ACE|nr:hypothetical protein [uncultured Pseudoflavonifractor sp.]
MKRASLERLARRLAAVLVLLGIAALILYVCYMDANAGKITFDAVVKEDMVLLVDEVDFIPILVEDGEEWCVCVRQNTRVTDEDGRELDLSEGIALEAGQPIRVTASTIATYDPVTPETCYEIVLLSP